MLKNFFISLLGALAAFWISIMLLVLVGVIMVISAAASLSSLVSPSAAQVSKNTVLVVPLDGAIEERATAPGLTDRLMGDASSSYGLDDILDAIAAAAADKRVSGIYLSCQGVSASGYATLSDVRQALEKFRQSGKWVVAYADSYTQADYFIATAADELYVNPAGSVDIRGLGGSVPFFKGLLDKLGIEMQVLKVGTYKSAVEPYLLTHMSEPAREQTRAYMSGIWGNIAGKIAEARDVQPRDVNLWADSLLVVVPADTLPAMGVVTATKYQRQVEDGIRERLGLDQDDDINFVTCEEYVQSGIDVPHTSKSRNKIAVYYAFGDIVDQGTSGISAEQVVPDILDLAKDDDVKALVLRVNSGGGSAFASEQIWEALEYFKSQGKPFYVSMGDVAASGGYYISCGADKIYAEPVTITGSIGIFGMIPCIKGLVTDKLGVNFDTVETNPNAVFPNIMEPMTEKQRAKMQGMIERGYDLFTRRCAQGRHLSQDSIKAIAEGRVWDGMQARRIGLVDEFGSLEQTVAALASSQGWEKYQVTAYPQKEFSFMEILTMMGSLEQERQLRSQLGALYPVYTQMRQLRGLNPVQARMEPLVFDF